MLWSQTEEVQLRCQGSALWLATLEWPYLPLLQEGSVQGFRPQLSNLYLFHMADIPLCTCSFYMFLCISCPVLRLLLCLSSPLNLKYDLSFLSYPASFLLGMLLSKILIFIVLFPKKQLYKNPNTKNGTHRFILFIKRQYFCPNWLL